MDGGQTLVQLKAFTSVEGHPASGKQIVQESL